MMKRGDRWLRGFGVLTLVCMVLFTFCGMVYGHEKKRISPVDQLELAVDISAFPKGWYVEYGPGYYPIPEGKLLRGTREVVGIKMSPPQNCDRGVWHDVFRYPNTVQATIAFH